MTSHLIDTLKVYFIENTSRLGRVASTYTSGFILLPTSHYSLFSAAFDISLPSAAWQLLLRYLSPQMIQRLTATLTLPNCLTTRFLITRFLIIGLSIVSLLIISGLVIGPLTVALAVSSLSSALITGPALLSLSL